MTTVHSTPSKRKERQSVSLSESATPFVPQNQSSPSGAARKPLQGHKSRRSTSLSLALTPIRPTLLQDSTPVEPSTIASSSSNKKKSYQHEAFSATTVPTSTLLLPETSFAQTLETKKNPQAEPIAYIPPRRRPSFLARQYLATFDSSAIPEPEDKYYGPDHEDATFDHQPPPQPLHYPNAQPQPHPHPHQFGPPPPPHFGFAYPPPHSGFFFPPPPEFQVGAFPPPPHFGGFVPPTNPYYAFPSGPVYPYPQPQLQPYHRHSPQNSQTHHLPHSQHQNHHSIPVLHPNSLGLGIGEAYPQAHGGRRSRSASYVHDVPVDVPPIEEDVEGEAREGSSGGARKPSGEEGESVCTGCGAEPVPSFVALIPCDHLVCHTCMNALINSAAHSPPRPLNCFKCGTLAQSFGPAFETPAATDSSGSGMIDALKESLRKGEARRTVEEIVEKEKWEKRMFPSGSSPTNSVRWNTPKNKAKIGARGRAPSSARSIFSGVGGSESADGTPDLVRETSPTRSKGTTGGGVGEAPESPDDDGGDEIRTPEQRRSRSGSLVTAHSRGISFGTAQGSNGKFFKSPVPPEVLKDLKEPTNWPVVRIDNIPWDITAADIEAWLPQGSLAPIEECVLAVHILCNRADGRTLNQCYVEAATVQAARDIVRLRDGRKLHGRPAHVTISDQAEFMSTIFPSWEPGFDGLEAHPGAVAGPLIMQTELTGLVTLCRLESPHACKVTERPYFNIITIIQKFPWHQLETYNSKQIVRLYNTSCAAIEILGAIRHEVPDWQEILNVFVDAVAACPVFRPAQKARFTKKSGLKQSRYPAGTNISTSYNSPQSSMRGSYPTPEHGAGGRRLSFFSPPSLRDNFVTVGIGAQDDGSPTPSAILDLAPAPLSPTTRLFKLKSRSSLQLPPLRSAISTPNLGQHHNNVDEFDEADNVGSPTSSFKTRKVPAISKPNRRRVDSVSKNLGVDPNLVIAIAAQLGVSFA